MDDCLRGKPNLLSVIGYQTPLHLVHIAYGYCRKRNLQNGGGLWADADYNRRAIPLHIDVRYEVHCDDEGGDKGAKEKRSKTGLQM